MQPFPRSPLCPCNKVLILTCQSPTGVLSPSPPPQFPESISVLVRGLKSVCPIVWGQSLTGDLDNLSFPFPCISSCRIPDCTLPCTETTGVRVLYLCSFLTFSTLHLPSSGLAGCSGHQPGSCCQFNGGRCFHPKSGLCKDISWVWDL